MVAPDIIVMVDLPSYRESKEQVKIEIQRDW